MASLASGGGNRWRIQVGERSSRKAVRFRGTEIQAERFRDRIARLALYIAQGNPPDADIQHWLLTMPDKLHARLVKAGLAKNRQQVKPTVQRMLDTFFHHLEVKPITSLGYQATRKALLEYFGAETAIDSIEPLQAEQWRVKMKADGLAEATISKRIGIAKHVFSRAVKWKWIAENPFADVRAGAQTNKARQFFITGDMARKVLEACPDNQWRLLFALSRYGGLRCPSEHLALKWSDVDFEKRRIRVTCSKTEHHPGRGERFVPLFPELEPLLLQAHDEAETGSVFVITKYRQANVNLRTQFQRIIRRAGLTPWERLFHNLRSSRQTELSDRFPAHVVASWIGNTERVAQNHYLQTTDAHFEAAVKAMSVAESGAQSGAQSAQYGVKLKVRVKVME